MCESSGCRGAGRQAWSAMQRGADAAKRGDVEELLENLAHSHVKVAKIEEVGVLYVPTARAVLWYYMITETRAGYLADTRVPVCVCHTGRK